ncbi:hypothetical protein GUITHDRAFT_144037 [Guillardia theta CCMP2712]|uniref:Uncharacterized protein n=1 Tax=Guillardia theta (strain CCMP2712) TaxID=905079 RepID=L1IS36_GUITC|nr:hypothetical protein GUITHDRAFT_144037 [Guillardia theta CCMP2712]EKX38640.1 hypothetical protein GUITHDRAFT_144037 [Guillardia theta CCMP2712]|eukprot:XP_005825620.1 hypothetical protein GUITHDRAFT_144037 [Guillardia theta CCMP2712]
MGALSAEFKRSQVLPARIIRCPCCYGECSPYAAFCGKCGEPMLGDAKVGYWTVDEAKSQQISNYQVHTPTAWNIFVRPLLCPQCSRDDRRNADIGINQERQSKVEEVCPNVVGAAVHVGAEPVKASGSLREFLVRWMMEGASITMTFNRQQAICSVDLQTGDILTTNPIKILSVQDVEAWLPSEASLYLRGNEVLFHCKQDSDEVVKAIQWPSASWEDMQVKEQILSLRKLYPGERWNEAKDSWVKIPYAGTGENVGPCLRLFAPRQSEAGRRILASRDEQYRIMDNFLVP